MSTNVFAKFGINHLSPSQLNTWREHPARWALQKLCKVRGPDRPWHLRGKAVEVGMEVLLRGGLMQDALGLALTNYQLNAHKMITDMQGEIPDDLVKQRDLIKPMLMRIEELLLCAN